MLAVDVIMTARQNGAHESVWCLTKIYGQIKWLHLWSNGEYHAVQAYYTIWTSGILSVFWKLHTSFQVRGQLQKSSPSLWHNRNQQERFLALHQRLYWFVKVRPGYECSQCYSITIYSELDAGTFEGPKLLVGPERRTLSLGDSWQYLLPGKSKSNHAFCPFQVLNSNGKCRLVL